jgi:hypothetical protein
MFSAQKSAAPANGKLYVEDVFSTWLYTGNAGSQTITNGIDLAGKGGLVWIKSRSGSGYNHVLTDTARGVNATLVSNSTAAQFTASTLNWAFLSSGFSINNGFTDWNATSATYASWTFRKAPKFFDVVTYTGTGANRTIAHSLGVAPGCILVKRTNTSGDWQVYHRSNANTEYMVLNTTAAKATGTTRWNSTTPTSTEFTVGTDATVNASGGTYVAYLFAHDATSDGVIQCGSFTTDGSGNATVNLGWEPQWSVIKWSSTTSPWYLVDDMRGFGVEGNAQLYPNNSNAEYAENPSAIRKTSTGFTINGWVASGTGIYIAIRRGPMKTPTLGTSVFAPVTQNGGAFVTTGFVTDMMIQGNRPTYGVGANGIVVDRLRGGRVIKINSDAENVISYHKFDYNNGVEDDYSGGTNNIYWNFRRAPGFFDEVCYTGPGSLLNVNHNLGVAPELMLIKGRSAVEGWIVYSASTGNDKIMHLNLTTAAYSAATWNNTTPSATTFTLNGGAYFGNISGVTYVAYLFASCPGVSKVGSYTGNGSSQTINCGFAAGARFVMIKRTDSSGDWYVWDTARGIVAGNDPHLSLNTTAAEVTTDDTIDTNSTGFVVNQVSATNVNVSSATYLYLAIS